MESARKKRNEEMEPAQHDTRKILAFYNNPDIAAGYGRQHYITPCERLLFDTYIKPGMAILDIGVGGGRTSEYLARDASRYVGIDYAPEMIQICQKKYPQREFALSSATDLSLFQDGSFNAVVMSYNMLDDVIPEENRWQCVAECHRVLKNGGLLIFSSHNPRAVIIRPEWKKRKASATKPGAAQTNLFSRLMSWKLQLHEFCSAVKSTAATITCYATKAPFWRGEGHMLDGEGLMTHFWIPAKVIAELVRFGFDFIAMQGDDYPRKSHSLITGWYYYVFSKRA